MSCNNDDRLKDKTRSIFNEDDIGSIFRTSHNNHKSNTVSKSFSGNLRPIADFNGSWAFAMDFLSKADKTKVFEIVIK